MKISTKLLVIFIPLILFPVVLKGYWDIRNFRSMSEEAGKIYSSIEKLQTTAADAAQTIEKIVGGNTKSDYEFINLQLKSGIELSGDYLARYEETLAASPLIESFMSGPEGARGLLSLQLQKLFENVVLSYNLSEICIVDIDGKEMIRVASEVVPEGGDPVFDAIPLPNRKSDESGSPWFKARLNNKVEFVDKTVYFEQDFNPPKANLSLCCPLRYKRNSYDPVNGNTFGYLRLAIPIETLARSLFSKSPGFEGEVVLTDYKNVIIVCRHPKHCGMVMNFSHPDFYDYVGVKQPVWGGQVVLHVLYSKSGIRRSSGVVASLARSIGGGGNQSRDLSIKAKERLSDIQRQTLFITVCTMILAIAIVAFVAKKISAPIISLAESTIWISSGNLKVKPNIGKTSVSEIRLLADHIDIMRLNLKKQIDNLDRTVWERTQKLREANRKLKKARDEAEDATRTKSEFLANMSHEIRTPMNAIMGLIDLVLRMNPTSRQRYYLNKIRTAASTLLRIIDDILDLSKIEAGKLELEKVNFNLNESLDNIADMFGGRAVEKGLEFIVSLDDDVPLALVGDPLRFGQVLINLVSNAVKFTEKGEITVSVSILGMEKEIVNLGILVRDTGVGIPRDKLELLFRSFTQADGSTTRKYGGTGLGLAISKRLVEMMNGRIEMESRENMGSLCRFSVEFGIQPDAVDWKPMLPDEFSGMRTLVAAKNRAFADHLAQMSISLGLDVVSVYSEKAVFEELKRSAEENPYRLVFIDCKLPSTGKISRGRIRGKSGADAKMILVTEKETDSRETKGRVFLDRPIKRRALRNSVVEVFGKLKTDPTDDETAESEEVPVYLGGSRVLLVEDNDINQQVAREILESAGLVVDIAENGKVAIDFLFSKNSAYDAVFMDVQMPVMDGLEATKAIRGKESELGDKRIPIIAMTAHAMKEDRDKCFESGMNDYLPKPIDSERIFTTLTKWIKPSDQDPKALSAPKYYTRTPEGKIEITGFALTDFPDTLPGIDMESALSRIGGNRKLFIKLINEFRSEYGDAAKRIRDALYMGDMEVVQHLSHTIKGLAGNFSAHDLYYAALNLEMGVRKGDFKDLGNLMDRLDSNLSTVLESAKNLANIFESGGSEEESVPHDDRKLGLNDGELYKFSEYLSKNNPRAINQLAFLKTKFTTVKYKAMMKNLEEQLDRFNFKGARRIFANIMKSVKISRRNDEKNAAGKSDTDSDRQNA